MKLEEAWNKIKAMENSERFKPNQIHSILADLGVFKTNPRIRLVLKTALLHNMWELVIKTNVTESEINLLKSQLEYYGFAEEPIKSITYYLYEQSKTEYKEQEGESIHKRVNQPNLLVEGSSSQPLPTSLSTDEEIAEFLNSILVVDQASFRMRGLNLQRLDRIKYLTKKGPYGPITGPELSFEITGINFGSWYMNLYVYDRANNLRDIRSVNSIYIRNEFSIINSENHFDLSIKPSDISKILLRIDDSHTYKRFFRTEISKVIKYRGIVESNMTHAKIIESQILYAVSSSDINGEISFYIRCQVISPYSQWQTRLPFFALIYDKEGMLRQKFHFSLTSLDDPQIPNLKINDEYFVVSESDFLRPNVLKIPFEDVGKIVIMEE